MALPSKIIEERELKGLPVPGNVRDAYDTVGGLTEELRNTGIMRTLGQSVPYYLEGSDWSEEPNVPTLDVVLSKLGIKEDDDPTGIKAARKFVDSFAEKQGAWKKKIERDPELGKRGWETVKDIFKQTANDLMQADIAEGRRKIASGEDEEGIDWLRTKVADIVAPRAVKAVEEGRSPTISEGLRDAFSNAAYAVPASRIIGTATRTLSPVVRGGAQVLSQAIAPSLVAATDYVADPNYGAGDLALDAGVGTLTNLGVNKVLGPWLAGKIGAMNQKVTRGRIPQSLKRVLEGGATPEDRATGLIRDSKATLEKSRESLARGLRSSENAPSKAAVSEASDIFDVSEALKEPLRTTSGKIVISKQTGKPIMAGDLVRLIEKKTGDELLASEAPEALGSAVQQLLHPKSAARVNGNPSKEFAEGVRRYSAIFRAHPEMKSLFVKSEPFLSKKTTDALGSIGLSYGVNQFGNNTERAAAMAGAPFGVDVKEVRKSAEAGKRKSEARAAVSDIIKAEPSLTDTDRKYLSMVEKDPDILKFSNDDGFKSWLLERGHRILSGTPAHRPLWEVK